MFSFIYLSIVTSIVGIVGYVFILPKGYQYLVGARIRHLKALWKKNLDEWFVITPYTLLAYYIQQLF